MLPLKSKYEMSNWALIPLMVDSVDENYLNWVSDPEVNEFLFLKNFRHSLESLKEFVKNSIESADRIIFGIYSSENKHIGNFSIYDINYINKTFDFGYFIGEKEFWGTDAGIYACIIGLSIAFDELKLRKTFTYVEQSNLRSRFVLQKLGFIKEAILKKRVFNNGKYVDSVVYSFDSTLWSDLFKKYNR